MDVTGALPGAQQSHWCSVLRFATTVQQAIVTDTVSAHPQSLPSMATSSVPVADGKAQPEAARGGPAEKCLSYPQPRLQSLVALAAKLPLSSLSWQTAGRPCSSCRRRAYISGLLKLLKALEQRGASSIGEDRHGVPPDAGDTSGIKLIGPSGAVAEQQAAIRAWYLDAELYLRHA